MQTIVSINNLLTERVPIYGKVSELALNTYTFSLNQLNQVYSRSSQRIKKAQKTSNELKEQTYTLFNQSAEEIIDYIEEKLSVPNDVIQGKDKLARTKNIINLVKEQYILSRLAPVCAQKERVFRNARRINEEYFIPVYIKIRATISISREFLMETLAERLGQLKMTYSVSKDSVTLFFSGQFNREKVMEKVTQNMNNFKNLTVNFVQKGFQVKMEKKQFFQNFMLIYEKFSVMMTQMKIKRIEQWNETKSKTMNLYNTILQRIKERQVEIKIEYYRQTRRQLQAETVPVTSQVSSANSQPNSQVLPQQQSVINVSSQVSQ